MIKFYVLNAEGVAVATKGYPLANGLRAVKVGDKSWNVTDHRSGATIKEGLKSLPTCVAFAKDTANQQPLYMDGVEAVKAAKKASRIAANVARKAAPKEVVVPEVVTPETEIPTITENAIEVDSTPVTK